jgi:hypothetical protein
MPLNTGSRDCLWLCLMAEPGQAEWTVAGSCFSTVKPLWPEPKEHVKSLAVTGHLHTDHTIRNTSGEVTWQQYPESSGAKSTHLASSLRSSCLHVPTLSGTRFSLFGGFSDGVSCRPSTLQMRKLIPREVRVPSSHSQAGVNLRNDLLKWFHWSGLQW